MHFYGFTLSALAVWRITHLLQAEDGPWDWLVRFRRLVGNGFWGGLLDCFYCLSLWVSAPLAWWLGESGKESFLLWLALSGAAILLERLAAKSPATPPTYWHEEN